MPLTSREAFRIGFLMKCAEEGLTRSQVTERIDKAAHLFKTAADGSRWLPSMGGLALGGLLAAPVAGGAMTGYMAHKLREDDIDADDVKKQELIAELKHWARQARERQKSKLLMGQ